MTSEYHPSKGNLNLLDCLRASVPKLSYRKDHMNGRRDMELLDNYHNLRQITLVLQGNSGSAKFFRDERVETISTFVIFSGQLGATQLGKKIAMSI